MTSDAHNDCQHSHSQPSNLASNGLKWAFFLNLFFAVLELGGGWWTNSLAITADAIHDFGDAFAIGLALLLERYGNKLADNNYTYGYRRYALLGALINGFILTLGSLLILQESILRLQNPQAVKPMAMMGFAVLGIIVNGFSAWKLSHDHGANQRMAMLHLLEDVIGWTLILVGAVIMQFYPEPMIDSILSILLSLFVLWNVYKIVRKLLRIFMQRMPEEIELVALQEKVLGIPGIKGMHAVQGWSLDGDEHTMSAHIKVDTGISFATMMELKCKIKDIFSHYRIRYSTIEFESAEDCCLEHEHEPKQAVKKPHHHHNH